MSEYRIRKRRESMTMLGGEKREVRYAVPASFDYVGRHGRCLDADVPIKCVRNVLEDEDRPESQWTSGGVMPAFAVLELYEPEEEDG